MTKRTVATWSLCSALLILCSLDVAAQEVVLEDHAHGKVVDGPGELELAVSGDGQVVVIAVNGVRPLDVPPARPRLFRSGNRGQDVFTPITGANLARGMTTSRDPSLTWTGAGTFYFATMGPSTNALVASSTNNGVSFAATSARDTVANTPALCLGAGCSTDQPHIAGDRRPGQDQVYIVWRNSKPAGAFFSAIGCSTDGGRTWSRTAIEPSLTPANRRGDFPRVTVGPDGSVYVLMATRRTNADLLLQRFSPCSDGLQAFWKTRNGVPAPSVIGHFTGVKCEVGNTIAGLDRCNDGNIVASPTVAVDDAHPNRVFVTFANEIAPGNHDIVRISTEDVTTLARDVPFPDRSVFNTSRSGARYFPWTCATGGRIFAGWYDRRTGTTRNNDNTEYFVADDQGREIPASDAIDRQCDHGWPTGGNRRESEACSRQPQKAGFCLPCPVGSQVGESCAVNPVPATLRCDYSRPACPAATACVRPLKNRGNGQYGDYNGIACGAGSAYVAWASTNPPSTLPDTAGLQIFFARVDAVPVPVRPPTSAECRACFNSRNVCMNGANNNAALRACFQEYANCRTRNGCR